MKKSTNKPSRLTKILVQKIHGGRKQDSKFWSNEFSLANDIAPREAKDNSSKSKKNVPVISLCTGIFIIILLVVVRPDLFPFLEYHNIYNNFIGSSSPKKPLVGESINPISHKKNYPLTENKDITGISPGNYNSMTARDLGAPPAKAKPAPS